MNINHILQVLTAISCFLSVFLNTWRISLQKSISERQEVAEKVVST